ncbi:MAG: NUDIX hydrolase [Thermoprotei archaeon]
MGVKVFESRKFSVYVEKFNLPNGKVKETAYVSHRGSVVVAPFLSEDEVVMLRQYRPIAGKWLVEFPAGTLEQNERPEETARRELLEEAGYEATKLTYLFSFYVSPGVTNEMMHAFVASGLKPGVQQPEEYEVIEVKRVKLDDLFSMATKGEIEDGKSLVLALYLLANRQRIREWL